ncbi:MAG: sulfurtransferase TusA family protein [Theionarchaea archaeon]|nr:sulfurtransferase TusA family protein [Theionarchaea archaeon]
MYRKVDNMKSDVKIDCTGMLCPHPIIELAKQKRKLQPGQILEMWADDEGAKKDVSAWCEQTGSEFMGSRIEGAVTRYFIRMR